ncbi:YigZ family protein [Glaciecola sp. MF2-115]|uniref:YigZ family protein n=1 Tax=Glaciecola sp. MF2-115 TaxID=3384827 RepID=UPI0039A374C7
MIKSYSIPASEKTVELEIKRSKFITTVINASDRQQADTFVKRLKADNPQANHVCWAYIAGSPDSTERSMSDDGEPSGTAGMPMLKILQHSGLGDVAVAVVRYFGGTKLGTGGLQRAYSDAVALVLQDLPLKLKVSRTEFEIEYDYTFQGAISRLLEAHDVENIQSTYQSNVIQRFAVATSDADELHQALIDLSSNNIRVSRPDIENKEPEK